MAAWLRPLTACEPEPADLIAEDIVRMTHPLVDRLRFTRSEFDHALTGVSARDVRRLEPMNSLSRKVGHLASQTQRHWRQGRAPLVPRRNALFGFGQPASAPSLTEMWAAWGAVSAANLYLDAFTGTDLQDFPPVPRERDPESNETVIVRMTGHYSFHTGEALRRPVSE